MDDFVPPAHGFATGESVSRDTLLSAFVRGAGLGRCDDLRIEGVTLITAAGAVTALRLEPGVLLVRAPGALEAPEAEIAGELASLGLRLVQADPPLADVVALMLCGLRGTPWDVWGVDADGAARALERAATGDVEVDLGATAARLRSALVLRDYEAELSSDPGEG